MRARRLPPHRPTPSCTPPTPNQPPPPSEAVNPEGELPDWLKNWTQRRDLKAELARLDALINPRTHWREDPSGLRFTPPHLRGLAPAGRLDIDSVGLLVLTQDGRVARQLIGEDSSIDKEYLVRVVYEGAGAPRSGGQIGRASCRERVSSPV